MPQSQALIAPSAAQRSRPTARLIAPGAALAGCVRAYLCRSTMGAALEPHDQLNFYPAHPLCTLTWFIEGSAIRAPMAAPKMARPMPGRVVFGGPHTRPWVFTNLGPVHVFQVMLMPDALPALARRSAEDFVDRLVALEDALDADWCAMADAVLHAQSDEERQQILEEFLEPRWRASRSQNGPLVRYRDWLQELGVRLADSGMGKGVRQRARRFKAHAGLPLRQLRHLSRAEMALFEVRKAAETSPELNWADIAQQSGFSDQAHLCREIGRFSGFSPAALRHRIVNDEAFWVYRLWS